MIRGVGRPIVPKEHGAWVVLYAAFAAGVGVAGEMGLPVVFLLVGITAASLANGSVMVLVRSAFAQAPAARRRDAWTWLVVYAGVVVAAFAPLLLLYRMTFLLPFGMGATFFLLLQAVLVKERGNRTLIGELAGAAGLTMVGALTHAVAVGRAEPVGAVLWLALFLFFASGVFYVRMRISGMVAQRKVGSSASNPELWPCLVYHGLLVVLVPALCLMGVLPWMVLVAFAPALWRAAAGLRREDVPLNVRRLGWSETAVAAAFVLLLVAAFWFAPVPG